MKYQQIQTLMDKNDAMMHIECSRDQFKEISKIVCENYKHYGVSILSHDEGVYERLSVQSYLKFYYELGKPQYAYADIIKHLELESYVKKKLATLDPGIVKRVLLARTLCVGSRVVLIEDPLEGIDSKSSAILVKTMAWMFEQGVVVVSASPSFRSVCLLPGNAYYIKNYDLVPLFESLDATIVDSVTAHQSGMDRIDIRIDGKTIMVNISDILFAESIDSVCNLYVKNSYIPTHYTLDELQTRLERWGFFRSHRSYLVNVQRISEVKQWTRNSYVISLEGNDSIDVPLSKRRYQEFQELLRSE